MEIKNLSQLASDLEEQAGVDGVTKHIAGAAVIISGGILIIKRISSELLLPEYWELPSGGREPHDLCIIDTLHRELKEETGLLIKDVIYYIGFFDYKTTTHKKVRQWNFLVTPENNKIVLSPTEHDSYKIINNFSKITDNILMSIESKTVLFNALHLLQNINKDE